MPFDFRKLVDKYSKPIIIEEETGGEYDHANGGKWKPVTKTWETTAAVFNLSSREIRGYAIQFGEGGTFTREDVIIYIHQNITIGAKVTLIGRKASCSGMQPTYKGEVFTVVSAVDHSDHAHGLRLYIARKADKRKFADGSEGDYYEA